ncbi:hypothetical protein ABPG77_000534 [Micractinium sp. CCAP 211/92]
MSECQFGAWDLPTVLTFENDFLTVPQNGDLSSSSSLDVTDLFLPELSFEGSAEATSSFSSPTSEASSRLDELPDLTLHLPLGDLHQRQEAPTPAALPLGPSGLRLQLDPSSVQAAWHGMGRAHPFQMQGPALAAATAAIPSTADLEASLSAAAQPSAPAPPRSSAAPSAAAAAVAEEARRAKEAAAAAQRARDAARRAAQRKSGERRVAFPARKSSADKRPRIKGRFVTRAEYEQIMAAQASVDRVVPAAA